MALQDPTDPTGYLDPAINDALAAQSDPYGFEWPPAHWQADPEPVVPPLPNQQLGGTMGVVESAAAPSVAGMEIDPPDQIEMPPENMRTVSIGEPRAPSVANVLGEPTAVDRPAPPPVADPTPLPEGFTGNRPEKSPDALGIEYGEDPIKLALAERDYLDRQQQFGDEQAQAARVRDEMRAQENYQRQLDAHERARADMAQLNNEAIALSKTKVDPDRWYRNRSTSGKIGAWVAAIVGGLVSGRTGGPNQGLANIMKMIDDDVDAQKADITNQQQTLGMRRGIISDSYARSGDAFRAAEAFRIASYERVKADLQTQQSQFDPRSARAIQLGKMIQDVKARSEAAQQAALDRYYKTHTADAELQSKLLANEKARRALNGGGMGASPMISRAQIKADLGFDPGRDLTDKELDKLIERRGKLADQGAKVEERAAKSADAARKANERLVGAPGEFKNQNGQEFMARSDKEGEQLRATKSAVDLLAQMRNEINRGIAKHGGESDYFKSADWQRQKSRQSMITAGVSKALQLGALDEGTTKLAEQLAGDVDPTSFWRDARPGLNQLVDNMTAKLAKDMGAQGYDGKPYVPPNLSIPGAPPTKSTIDQLSEGAQSRNFVERHEGSIRFGGNTGIADMQKAAGDRARMQHIDALAFAADNPDPGQRDAALAALERAANDGPTDATKQYARAVLDRIANMKPGEHAADVITRGSR